MAEKHVDAAKLADYIKGQKTACANYEAAVTLICVVQNWLDYNWGEEGLCPGAMRKFDRFPTIDNHTPDFLVSFSNGYHLLGEAMRTFRTGIEGQKDSEQVLAYSKCRVEGSHHDVLVLVRTENDDVACSAIAAMRESRDAAKRPAAPIVLLGYHKDPAVDGEYLILKWRDLQGNSRFSPENVPTSGSVADLNSEICNRSHCALRIDERVVHLKNCYPLTNDEPPPIYTAMFAVWPAIAVLLSEDERDEMERRGEVEKEVTIQDLLACSTVPDAGLSVRRVEKALSFLEGVGLAKRVHDDQAKRYRVQFQQPPKRSELDFFADKEARSRLRLEKQIRRPSRTRKRRQDSAGQVSMLFDG